MKAVNIGQSSVVTTHLAPSSWLVSFALVAPRMTSARAGAPIWLKVRILGETHASRLQLRSRQLINCVSLVVLLFGVGIFFFIVPAAARD